MKKTLLLILSLVAVLSLVACGKDTPTPTATADPSATPTATATPTPVPFDASKKSEGVMTYAQYAAAKVDDPVVIECFVQATQSWYKDQIVIYAADPDGAYFIYNAACSEADSKKLVPGTMIKVTGFKAEYAGEVELAAGATIEFKEGSYIVENPVDITDLLAKADTAALLAKQNSLFTTKSAVIVPSIDAEGKEVAWLYKYNGSGSEGDDLYFNINVNGNIYTFTVESYLCGKDTDVYKAVKNFKIGDVVDLEGFLYWYNGVNPHTTKATVTGNVSKKSAGVMTYAEYAAAKADDAVTIECYVQATQSWYKDQIVVYAADTDGAYFIYNMNCSEADSKKLVPGTKIKVTGFKGEYAGEVELAAGATFEFEDGSYIVAASKDLTALFAANDEAALLAQQNSFFSVKGATVMASQNADGENVAWLYKYNGSGSEGDDLYFNINVNDHQFTFTVESYLCDATTDVYKAVKELKIGDTIDLEGFLYWYNGVNPHTTSIKINK